MSLENNKAKIRPGQDIFRKSYLYAKRLIDLVCSVALLLLLFPLFIAVAVAIKVDSPGPVFIRSIRIGRWGLPFSLCKFRTMVLRADEKMKEYMHLNEMSGPVFKMKNDPRVTRVGMFLRKTSLDELPQIWNVLKGEMSIVGPRPAFSYEVDDLIKENPIRVKVLPGITGLWQISGETVVSFRSWTEADSEYVNNMSFWLDLKIIVRTIPALITGKGGF